MEERIRVVETAPFLEEICALVQEVDMVPLLVSGSSMTPFLVHRRDTVYLSRIDRPLRRGDMVLYRRDSGAYVLHRICAVEHGAYALVGDAQTEIEHGIRPDQIFAVVRFVKRKGKRQEPGCFWWEFFSRVWIRIIPARPFLRRLYSWIGRKT